MQPDRTPLGRRARRLRAWVHRRPAGAKAWRFGIALIGLVVIVVGVVLLALPGPGWLVIFAGLGIWATEFVWAGSLLTRVRRLVEAWTAWLKRQPSWLTVLVGVSGVLILAAVAFGAWTIVS